jgi:regulator of replication initiation timing
MRGNKIRGSLLRACFCATILMLSCTLARGQEATAKTVAMSPQAATPDVRALADAIRSLQVQVQTLNSQVNELRTDEQRWHAEARELRSELELTRAQLASHPDALNYAESSTSSQKFLPPSPNPNVNPSNPPEKTQTAVATTLEQRLAQLEDNQDLLNAKINEQSQTKVESGSKYRVRLSGIVLLNLFDTRGPVDNADFPQLAVPATLGNSSNTFAATIRQSQIGLEVFGPEIAGARTSANVKFDFAGGFADLPNGVSMGVARLRTGTIRMDWANTSIIAGQDSLFFAPLTPTSLSSLAVPPLAYAGNLWSWTPQIRIEHRKDLSEASSLLFEAGILDSLTGDIPVMQGYRAPTAGEQSGQPGYAGRIAWTHHLFERNFTAGVGGYYGRQNWDFGRDVDGWAATADVSVPLGRFFTVTGEFYRGRAVGGLAGGVGQDILLSGAVTDPTTTIRGLDSIGGWTQLKFKPTAKFEVNAALGIDNPFASELRRFPATQYYYDYSISRNLSPFINFIYQVRSDVLFSAEFKRIQTYTLDSNFNAANQFGISIGYIF